MKKQILILIISVILVNMTNAQTYVSGGIYSNTTWTKANSPYIVTDTVVVFPGVTLTIQAGVEIKFNDNIPIEIRKANIITQSTVTDSITFTSNSLKPEAGIWAGIYLNECSNITFKYSNIKYAKRGIISNSGFPIYFNHTKFINNYIGIGNMYAPGTGGYIVDSCDFRNNVYGNFQVIVGYYKNSNFINNKSAFYYLRGGQIEDCIIRSNGTGISGSGKIKNCIIDSNRTVGIVWSDVSSPNYIINSTVSDNEIGIKDSISSSDSYIEKSIIEKNNIGIIIKEGNINVYCNKISNNINWDLYCKGSINFPYFINNDWGTNDSTIIASHIYDGYDNINIGLVTFIPIDTTKCYLTGCNLKLTAKVNNSTCDSCHNGSSTAQVENGNPPYTWTWYTSPIQTTQTATGLASGTYTVCVTDGKGCSACLNSVFIDSTNCSGFSIKTYGLNATCATCADGKAWVKKTGGSAPYKYTWFTKPMQANDTARSLIQGKYKVCVSDRYGCTVCDSVEIQTGNCSAHFELYPTDTAHIYHAVNMVSGVEPFKYLWDWDDGTFDTIPYPTHKYSEAKYYKICLTIIDFKGCINSYCNQYYLLKSLDPIIEVKVIPNNISGVIQPNVGIDELRIYPNPADEMLNVEFLILNKENINLMLFDITGREIHTPNPSQEGNKISIDVSGLCDGVYFVRVSTNDYSATRKIVIQH